MQGDAHAEALSSARAEVAAAQARAVDAQARAGAAAIEVERLIVECASARSQVAELQQKQQLQQQQQPQASSTAAGRTTFSGPPGVSPSPQRGGGGGRRGRSAASSPLPSSQPVHGMKSSLRMTGMDDVYSPFPRAAMAVGGLQAMGGLSAAASPTPGGLMLAAASPAFGGGPGRSAVQLSLPPMASPQGGSMQQAAAEQEVGGSSLPSSRGRLISHAAARLKHLAALRPVSFAPFSPVAGPVTSSAPPPLYRQSWPG